MKIVYHKHLSCANLFHDNLSNYGSVLVSSCIIRSYLLECLLQWTVHPLCVQLSCQNGLSGLLCAHVM